jgi:ankyrin repeat protein
LLALGADPNIADKSGETPCTLAAYKGSVACLRALRAGGPGGAFTSVNAVNSEGKTALDEAEGKNHSEAAAFLRDELGALRAADL